MTDDISRRAEHFRDNWLAWTALRHFLSVHLFRELACVIVERVSDGAFQFHELFEEEVTGGADFLASWLLIPRNISGPIPEYLQRQLGSFTWQTDGDVYVPDGVASAGMLEKAASLGKADFGTPDVAFANIPAEHQLSFGAFAQAILAAKKAVETSTSEQFVETLRPLFASIDTPLVCAAVKHIGDLCADADHWENALSMYEEAGRRLATLDQPQWSGFIHFHSCRRSVEGSSAGYRNERRASVGCVCEGTSASHPFKNASTACECVPRFQSSDPTIEQGLSTDGRPAANSDASSAFG